MNAFDLFVNMHQIFSKSFERIFRLRTWSISLSPGARFLALLSDSARVHPNKRACVLCQGTKPLCHILPSISMISGSLR